MIIISFNKTIIKNIIVKKLTFLVKITKFISNETKK